MGKGSVREVFFAFLHLGLTCFGGPIAHFAFFRQQFVERRKWISEVQFGHLLTLCQFLPGPGSSKLGFALGLLRAGWPGAIAAFVAFTAPSALLLFGFAAVLPTLSGAVGQAAVHGLKLVALSVVAFGLFGMTRALCPDLVRRLIAILAAAIVLSIGQAWAQLLVVVLGAACGATLCRNVRPNFEGDFAVPFGAVTAWMLLASFTMLLLLLPLAAHAYAGVFAYAEAFFRTGALAFGGGHVVLPLLQDAVVKPGWISSADFLAGYGAAQAVPGPMFALSAYLGARLPGGDGGLLGASVALVATFLPGFLLVAGILPLWRALALHPVAARAIAGVCGAVVGMLAA
ncbi:MAG TPA: chromate efflux transporter, partial [Burkholderiaceae bacterium]|nr:chromate efflux transporter [Burkholderiaceae bacterium]